MGRQTERHGQRLYLDSRNEKERRLLEEGRDLQTGLAASGRETDRQTLTKSE